MATRKWSDVFEAIDLHEAGKKCLCCCSFEEQRIRQAEQRRWQVIVGIICICEKCGKFISHADAKRAMQSDECLYRAG